MQLILKRLTAKITESESDQQSSGSVSIDDVVDHDFVPHISGDEAYHVIGHPGADGGVPTEQIARLQMPEDNLICSDMRSTHHKAQIKVSDIPNVLHDLEHSVKVLSLDCFDTLLWRKTATPSDVFAVLAEDPVARRLEITPHQRISAAARAYRAKRLENRSGEIDIGDIYRLFTSLSGEERELLAEAEIRAEMNVCFAFSPFVELIRLAHTRGIKIVIVSDTYLREDELTRLLTRHLPADVMRAISKIYCSVDHGTSKSHGLFRVVIEQCGVPAAQILHIGDNDVADAQAPQKLGLRALHFQPFDREVADFLRLQHAASSLIVFEQPAPEALVLPCYSPFRPLFSVAKLRPYAPETVIGYMSFGPVLYAYARFLMDEVAALQKQGKRVRVLFLLRDAYLLSAACEAYTGKSVGKLVRIRRFVAIAASFKNRADVDYYISGISPEFFNLHSIAKQLLLPPDVTELLIRIARQSDDPRRAFHQSLHDDDVMELILKNSFALRGRMMRYMSKQLGLEEGDTVVLADTGYHGNTHQYLARTFKDEMKVDIMSRYVVASDEPYHAANSKALFTSSWWNYDLFEQCCAIKEGAVVDYDVDGEAILGEIILSDKQYEKVAKVQAECVRFIDDARTFFTKAGVTHEYSNLQAAAHAALFRHAHMPIEAELEFFKDFEYDDLMGPHRKKTIFHLESAWKDVRCLPSPYRLGAYETRSLGLDFTFSGLVQRGLKLDLNHEDMNVRFSPLKVAIGDTYESKVALLRANHLHDGYFSIVLPYVSGTSVKMLLGEHYEWLQIDDIRVLNKDGSVCKNVSGSLDLEEIDQEGDIYRCLSQASAATIRPVELEQFTTPCYCHMIFRPLVSRASAPTLRRGASQIKEENYCLHQGPRPVAVSLSRHR